MSANYLPIEEIIKIALSEGISLGRSNPRFHLAYLGKLGLIPHATKRKINGAISGCYEEAVVATLKRIEGLKEQGFSYSQIKLILTDSVRPLNTQSMSTPIFHPLDTITGNYLHNELYPSSQSQTPLLTSSIVLLIIGLLMGFFAGSSNLSNSAPYGLSASPIDRPSPSSAYQTTVNSSLDDPASEMLRLISTGSQSEEPLYIIALPKENFGRLGKTNINKLISQ